MFPLLLLGVVGAAPRDDENNKSTPGVSLSSLSHQATTTKAGRSISVS